MNDLLIRKKSGITYWLLSCCWLVLLMIFIGGLTRLTNSGLSIVEWKPVTGIIPPLNNYEWQVEFDKYKLSPEYIKYNFNIGLLEFKFIYYLEFIHRFLARLTIAIYVIPLIYFYITKKILKSQIIYYLLILILFFMQALVGWYMVKSGLVNIPHVCHYRLGLHLILAVILYSLLYVQYLKSKKEILVVAPSKDLLYSKLKCQFILGFLYIQIIFGALVAGLKGGLIYNNFPLMGKNFVPPEVNLENLNLSLFNDPVWLQFIHRINAYILVILIIFFIINLFKTNNKRLKNLSLYVIFFITLQILSGVITLIFGVPLLPALFHQINSILLLSSILAIYNFLLHENICYNK